MIFPKPLTIEIPKIKFPLARLANQNDFLSNEEKDFEIGELYKQSKKDETKLSPRDDISPSVYKLSRVRRRKHSYNFL